MFCAAYKSNRKADTYLYVQTKDKFDDVPEPLLKSFGVPQFVMVFNTKGRKTVAGKRTQDFVKTLESQGFYLQLPPKVESLLTQHQQLLKDK